MTKFPGRARAAWRRHHRTLVLVIYFGFFVFFSDAVGFL